MNLLAFEASTAHLSVALACAGGLTERSARVPNGGSERLLPWVSELLADAGLTLRQLDGIAFGAGPGSFTGLRLACGVAQGLAFGLDRPVVPVGTLAALALAHGDGKIIASLDARMNELYIAAYAVAGDRVDEIMPPKVSPGETAPLPDGEGWWGVGDGFDAYDAVLRRRMGERLVGVEVAAVPTAAAVLRLAMPVFARGDGVEAARAQPLYVREKVALTTAERLARGGAK